MRFNLKALLCASALTACGEATSPDQGAAPETAAMTQAPTSTPPSGAVTGEMLLGRWGDNGDCTKDVVFNGDGTFRSYTGLSGTWLLNGDRVRMTGAEGTFEVGVELLNDNTLLIRNADGSMGTSQRCDGAGK